jgi:hypothetical protein
LLYTCGYVVNIEVAVAPAVVVMVAVVVAAAAAAAAVTKATTSDSLSSKIFRLTSTKCTKVSKMHFIVVRHEATAGD